MDIRRAATPDAQAASNQQASAFARPLIESGVTARELLVAGGLRGFTPKEMFGGAK